ncbi:MAG TPA: ATP-dependent sacrificial sulfur transferase LarE [Acidimicrobiales bacterium]|nr:ATP-dependent sacrificial sulfur transferase LarE [Acidimicrobiales bacterium]
MNRQGTTNAGDRLTAALSRHERLVVAFSGGADSALIAWWATDVLGPDAVLCVTAVSPSLALGEREDARALAEEWGLRWCEVVTDEISEPAYVANDTDRCAHCKTALMDELEPLARAEGAAIALGVNVDDLGDHRPGQAVAAERGAVFPFVEAGLTKADVRSLSRDAGLRTWDKPAAACLSSRIPYGTPVTLSVLDSVGRAEAKLRALGFAAVRVRHYGSVARLEVPVEDFAAVLTKRASVVDAVLGAGYGYVTLDLEGLRSGNLNRGLAGVPTGPPEHEGN